MLSIPTFEVKRLVNIILHDANVAGLDEVNGFLVHGRGFLLHHSRLITWGTGASKEELTCRDAVDPTEGGLHCLVLDTDALGWLLVLKLQLTLTILCCHHGRWLRIEVRSWLQIYSCVEISLSCGLKHQVHLSLMYVGLKLAHGTGSLKGLGVLRHING